MMLASKSQYQRALEKASALRAWNNLNRISPTCWEYLGERCHILTLQGEDILCSCPAGQRELPCYHASALFIWRAGERMVKRQAEREVAAVSAPASRRDGVLAPAGGGSRRPLYDAELDGAPAFGGLGA